MFPDSADIISARLDMLFEAGSFTVEFNCAGAFSVYCMVRFGICFRYNTAKLRIYFISGESYNNIYNIAL